MRLLAFLILALCAPARAADSEQQKAAQQLWKLGLGYFADGKPDLAYVQWLACANMDASHEECRQALEGVKKLLSGSLAAEKPVPEPPREKERKESRKKGKPPSRKPEADDAEQRRAEALLHWNEGVRHFEGNNLAKARDEWALCGLLDPSNAQCAEGLRQIASSQSAAAAPKEAKPSGKNEATRHWNAGIMHFQSGAVEKAREEWELCRKADPSNKDCADGLERITFKN